jgi:phospholipase D1/2
LPLVRVTAALWGVWLGSALSLFGALASALVLYAVGGRLGRARVRRLAGWRVNRVNRALARHGVMAMLLLRLMPMASFSVVNLVAGAAAVRLGHFLAGTVLGMAPGLFALSVVGDRAAAVLRHPTLGNVAMLALATVLVLAAQLGVVSRLARARAPQPGGTA